MWRGPSRWRLSSGVREAASGLLKGDRPMSQSAEATPWWSSQPARTFGAYGFAALLSCLIVTVMLRLWETDLSVPFVYICDGMFANLWIKSLIDNGWYLTNPFVGAPTGLEMHDYPLGDNLHLGIMKALSLVIPDYGLVINLYYLLGFPLVTLTSLFAFRRFTVSYGPALFGSIVFAF